MDTLLNPLSVWFKLGCRALQVALLTFTVAFFLGAAGSTPAAAKTPNFHPCNADPSLPVCKTGYGRRIAVRRWGAQPEPVDPDAGAKAALVTRDPAAEIKKLKSSAVLVLDLDTSETLFARDEDAVRSIASITKLMTAVVVFDADLPLDEMISVRAADRNTSSDLPSRLPAGTQLTRAQLLQLALAASENTAANALARSYPGGTEAFVDAMNAKAQALGMRDSRFVEPTGLSNENRSTARDLIQLLEEAARRPLMREFSTKARYLTADQTFGNTNMLVGRPEWDILLSKTGTTREAGDCLVMVVELEGRQLAIVLLNAHGMRGARFGDAVRVRRIVTSEWHAGTTVALP